MNTQTTKALRRTELGYSTSKDAEYLRAQIGGLEAAIEEMKQQIQDYQENIALLLATIEGAIPDE